MHQWEQVYKNNEFSIRTSEPSILVREIVSELRPHSKILDLGCGNGRNAIFLASMGHRVDAIDVADLGFLKDISEDIRKNINFTKKSVICDFEIKSYDLIIAARLIQYLAPAEVEFLVQQSFLSSRDSGILLISYNISGGIFEQDNIKVDKYSHSINSILGILNSAGFRNKSVSSGSNVSKYVPYSNAIESFDIIARKS